MRSNGQLKAGGKIRTAATVLALLLALNSDDFSRGGEMSAAAERGET